MLRALVAGLRAMRRAPLQQAVGVGAVAVALTLLGLVRLVGENASRVVAGWGRGVQMTVYLEDSVPEARARQIADILERLPGVQKVETVEPRAAYERLKRSLGEHSSLLDGVEDTMLPISIEVSLKPGIAEALRMDPAYERLRHTPGVEDVELMGDWVRRVAALVEVLQRVGLALAALVAAACLFVVGATLRLGVAARREEIAVLKLVGATDGFVRGPYLVEGAAQGLGGAGCAMALLYALHHTAAPWIERTLGGALGGSIAFLRPWEIAAAVALGTLAGMLASAIAVGRYARA
jgi:cell division transport system permease protein